MQKKKILFVQESLTLAGGEKSLIALLTNLDPEKYDIDLQLFRFGGALDALIPSYVHVLPAISYTDFASQSWLQNLLNIYKKKHFKFLISKLKYSLGIRKGKFSHPEMAQTYWESIGKVIEKNPKEYDVAIAYAQGIPTFYTIEKTKAKKKIAWINAKPNFYNKNKIFQEGFYKNYNAIVPVTSTTYEQMNEVFPQFASKLNIIEDIVDYKSIIKMADFKKVKFKKDAFNILTVARLNLKSKRYDIALDACRILKEKGIEFHWYALGAGSYKEEMEKYIAQHHLENHFTFLGTTPNPYPYFKAADLYVQTSEFESYGISIAEARLLNIPIVTTRYDSVDVQIQQEHNGLITDLNGAAVAEGIIRLMEDKELYNKIKENLKKEEKENLESVKKFDALVGD